jgi:hypothetical protein
LENLFASSQKAWNVFDLYYFSFNVTDQVHQPELPGILVSPPIKKGSHGRDGDLVILYLSLTGKNRYTPDELNNLLQRSALAYYKSTGSLTAGMRAVAEVCNSQLTERNLKNAREEGGQTIGRLNIAVMREDTLFLAVAGLSHAFAINAQEVQDFYDPQAGHGLGVGSAVALRYFQARVQAGDVLAFTPDPPDAWTPDALAGSAALTLEHLRRRLLNGIGPNLQAVVFKFQSGNGEVHALRHRSAAPQPPAAVRPSVLADGPSSYLSEAPRSAAPDAAPASHKPPPPPPLPLPRPPASRPVPTRPPLSPVSPASGVPEAASPSAATPQRAEGVENDPIGAGFALRAPEGEKPSQTPGAPTPRAPLAPHIPLARTAPRVATGSGEPVRTAARRNRAEQAASAIAEESAEDRQLTQAAALEAARLARQRRNERKQKAAVAWNGWKNFYARAGRSWQGLLVRLAPQRTNPTVTATPGVTSVHASPALLIFIAIAVPLIVVAVSMTVYTQTGRSEQRVTYYQQAVAVAEKALAEKDLTVQRSDWEQVLTWLDKTEAYGITDESRALRARAQQGVDSSESVTRLEFQPINRVGFANAVQVVRMVSSGDDLYLLDASDGSVLRLFLTAQGYVQDTLFNCGPGPSGSIFVGALVDISTMPPVNPNNATIAAVDGNGNLLYCIPGKSPISHSLAPPNVGWGKIAAMSLSQDSLYLMDILGNAIWQYTSNDLAFKDPPHLFSENFNITMADMIDMTMYEDNVYFLRKDGHLVECLISRVQDIPTRCADPAKFTDTRPGRDPKPAIMPGTLFTQFLSINAPDPSIYVLDSSHASIYRFSVVLTFQDQMRPSGTTGTPLPRSEPTAFTITPHRIAFLAYGNQVFMAQMP